MNKILYQDWIAGLDTKIGYQDWIAIFDTWTEHQTKKKVISFEITEIGYQDLKMR